MSPTPQPARLFGFVIRTWLYALLGTIPFVLILVMLFGGFPADDLEWIPIGALLITALSLPVLVVACLVLWLLCMLPLKGDRVFVLWLLLLVAAVFVTVALVFRTEFSFVFPVHFLIMLPVVLIATVRYEAFIQILQ